MRVSSGEPGAEAVTVDISAEALAVEENHHGHISVPSFGDGSGQHLGSTLHQINRLDGLVLNRIFIKLLNLGSIENLHLFLL